MSEVQKVSQHKVMQTQSQVDQLETVNTKVITHYRLLPDVQLNELAHDIILNGVVVLHLEKENLA